MSKTLGAKSTTKPTYDALCAELRDSKAKAKDFLEARNTWRNEAEAFQKKLKQTEAQLAWERRIFHAIVRALEDSQTQASSLRTPNVGEVNR